MLQSALGGPALVSSTADTTHGSIAQKLMASGMNINSLRTNDVLRFRDWILLDKTVIEVARQRLVLLKDLFDAGLRYPVDNALGVTRVEWERISDFGTAEVNMSGVAEGRSDRVKFDMNAVPLPIVHKDFNINIRALEASRRNGHALDTTQAALATRIVVEKLEDIVVNGSLDMGTANGKVYGYATAPNAITTALTYDWSLPGTTGEHRIADLMSRITALYAQNMFGPFMIYIPLAWYVLLMDDFKANSDKSMLSRLLEIPGVKGIKPSQNLTDHLVMVQLTSDVVDVIDGIQPTVVQWETHGGMVQNFKVMAIIIPRMKSTQTNQSGIVYAANGATTP